MVTDCDVLPRQGFTKMANNMRCQLYFPFPTEQVVLLRTGILVHINAYMRSLGFLPDTPQTVSPLQVPRHDADINANGSDGEAVPVSLKAQMASNASAGVLGNEAMQGNGMPSLADAMDVDSPAGDFINIRHLSTV